MEKLLETLKNVLTWWNRATLVTKWTVARHGVRVGEDEAGNTFYRSKQGDRRWVIYGGVADASQVSPDWHGWLHHTWDEPPTEAPLPRKAWEKDHKPNMTGTALAYRPPGSVLTPQTRPRATGDYEAWQPE
ncbi:MAG: NADH:ubiquinone oxidoreductase subunit NDUFA12 [Pseudomonadota bacterium]